MGLTYGFFLLKILNILTHIHKRRGEKVLKHVLCIQELSPFRYISLLVSLKSSSFSPCVCVLKYLVFSKEKNSRLILHWKIGVNYRGLKPVLCIQELGLFGYTIVSFL